MKRLKVIHYGIAHDHSAVTMECVRKYPDLFEVVGVCEPDEASRKVAPVASSAAWTTSRVWVPMDPVEPRMAIFFIRTYSSFLCSLYSKTAR